MAGTITFTMPDGAKKPVDVPEGMDARNLKPEQIQQLFRSAAPQGSPQAEPGPPGSGAAATPTAQPAARPLAFLTQPDSPVSVQAPPGGAQERGPLLDAIAARTSEPFQQMVDPGNSLGSRAMGAVQLGSTVAFPEASIVGAMAQTVGRLAGMDNDTANMLSQGAEIFKGASEIPLASAAAARAGKKLLGLAEGAGQKAGFLSHEVIGADLVQTVKNTLGRRAAAFGTEFDAIEQAAVKQVPLVAPGTPAYDEIKDVITKYTNASPIAPAGKAETLMATTARRVASGNPVPTQDLIDLRKFLREQAKFSNSPDASAAARFAADLHGDLTDAFEAALPSDGPNSLAARFHETSVAYKTQWADPMRALRTALSSNSTSVEAFNEVFRLSDPNAFRTVLGLAKDNPAILTKLRAGFIDSMRGATNEFDDPQKALGIIQNSRKVLTAMGMFHPDEMTSLEVLFRKNAIPRALDNIMSVTPTKAGGAVALAFLARQHPGLATGALIAAGALPELRRLAVLPSGSPAAKRFAGLALAKLATVGLSLGENQVDHPDDVPSMDLDRP